MIDRKRWIERHFREHLTSEGEQVLELLPEHVRSALFHAAEACYNTGHQDAWSMAGTGRIREFYVPDDQSAASAVQEVFPHEVA